MTEKPLTILVEDYSEMMWSDYDSFDDLDLEPKNSLKIDMKKSNEDIKFLKKFSGISDNTESTISDKINYKNKNVKLNKTILKQDNWVVLEVDELLKYDEFDDFFHEKPKEKKMYVLTSEDTFE